MELNILAINKFLLFNNIDTYHVPNYFDWLMNIDWLFKIKDINTTIPMSTNDRQDEVKYCSSNNNKYNSSLIASIHSSIYVTIQYIYLYLPSIKILP